VKVSIITVTYNSEKYLADCIASVRKQTYRNIEHIIVDGKSTDGTLKIIQKNEAYLAHWISETDRGMYDAINKGIKLATGDIIGVLNSDDMLASADVIMDIVACFDEKKVDSVYGDLVYVDPANPLKVIRHWKGMTYKRSRFNYGWMPAHPTFYIRRELIDQFGDYENHYYTAADYEFMARYLYHHKISATYLPKMIVKMRNGGASNSTLYRRLRANRRDYLAMKKNRIPFAFFVSILKPLIKIPQYKSTLGTKVVDPTKPHKFFSTTVLFFPADAKAEAEG
jgi:glycosyltransferase involved in cell wall biosynthesis